MKWNSVNIASFILGFNSILIVQLVTSFFSRNKIFFVNMVYDFGVTLS